jgi:hypothetical protein
MAINIVEIIPAKQAENTQTTQYTATNCRTIVDKFTITNTSAANETITVNLVDNGGSASDGNTIIDTRTIAPQESYTCPEIVGHVIAPNGFISTLASAASALTIRATGREIS